MASEGRSVAVPGTDAKLTLRATLERTGARQGYEWLLERAHESRVVRIYVTDQLAWQLKLKPDDPELARAGVQQSVDLLRDAMRSKGFFTAREPFVIERASSTVPQTWDPSATPWMDRNA